MLSLSPLFFIWPHDVKHSEKPTEQPVEQWYASLVGKVPTKYLSKGCGYGFQRYGKVRYVDLVLEENEKDDNSLKLYRDREKSQKLCRSRLRQPTHEKKCAAAERGWCWTRASSCSRSRPPWRKKQARSGSGHERSVRTSPDKTEI
jgi:hypothetical protein